MQSLAEAMEPYGWMMWHALAQSHHWIYVSSVDGASTTVVMVKMQEWCVKVLITHKSSFALNFEICNLHTLYVHMTLFLLLVTN